MIEKKYAGEEIIPKKEQWMYSDDFIKRAIAIWGYSFVGGLIVFVIAGIGLYVLSIIFGLMG